MSMPKPRHFAKICTHISEPTAPLEKWESSGIKKGGIALLRTVS